MLLIFLERKHLTLLVRFNLFNAESDMIFMAHIESFNFTGPLASAAKFFIKNLPLEDTFSDSLPPAGSNGSGDSKMRVETQKDEIVYVRV